ncbi:MAG: hypothetical protein QM731_10005 [Chitinophagaceae bacterium]
MKLHTLLGLTVIGVVVAACSKNYESKPSLKITSVSSTNLQVNEALTISLEYTDKEGDFDSVWVKKIRTNLRTVAVTLRDSFWLNLSKDAPDNKKGKIDLVLDYNNYVVSAQNPPTDNNGNPEPDTLIFKIVLKDKARNFSDTVSTDKIRVSRG